MQKRTSLNLIRPESRRITKESKDSGLAEFPAIVWGSLAL